MSYYQNRMKRNKKQEQRLAIARPKVLTQTLPTPDPKQADGENGAVQFLGRMRPIPGSVLGDGLLKDLELTIAGPKVLTETAQ